MNNNNYGTESVANVDAYVDNVDVNNSNKKVQKQNSNNSKLKMFLGNKNTVTVLCAIIGVLVLWFFYKYNLNSATQPIKVPYAKQTIQPKQQITEDMIGYVTIARNGIQGGAVIDITKIIGQYSNVNTMIPEGSLFYKDALISREDLPDVSLYDKPENETLYYLSTDMVSSYYNSILPGNYIDLYVQTKGDDNKVMVGKLISNVKVLAVKTADGLNVFENSDEKRIPATIIFSLPEDLHLLLRKAAFVKSVGEFRIELIAIPTSVSINSSNEKIEVNVSSSYIKQYIEEKSTYIPEDIIYDDNEE